MQDFSSDTETPTKNSEAKRQVIRELERRSQDILVVYNPTQNDFEVVWDQYVNVVTAKKETNLPRYIAEKYIKEMTDALIGDENIHRVNIENDKRLKFGQKALDPQEREIFDLRSDNAELRKKYIGQLYRGVSREYGKDVYETPKMKAQKLVKTDADLMAEVDLKQGVVTPDVTEPIKPPQAIEPLPDGVDDAKLKASVKFSNRRVKSL